MRYARLLSVLFVIVLGTMALNGRSAYAAFHCMRIHAVMGGYQGDPSIQYVELRQVGVGQNAVSTHKIRFYDASNTLQATFTFPASPTVAGGNGASILIGTTAFNGNTIGGDADYTFTGNTTGLDPDTPVQSTGGKVVWAGEPTDFDCLGGSPPSDSVAYGSYSGTIDFGTMTAPALPASGTTQALVLNSNDPQPPNNANDYGLQGVVISSQMATNFKTDLDTPRKNSGLELQLALGGVGGVAAAPDVSSTPLAGPDAGGSSVAVVAAIAAGAAAGVAGLGGAAWALRRRRSR